MENFKQMNKLILLNPQDNVFIARQYIMAGDEALINGKVFYFEKEIPLGHKVAAKEIQQGERIIKYGVPIGSATENITGGTHIHLHNMKSDYIQTYTIEKKFGHEE